MNTTINPKWQLNLNVPFVQVQKVNISHDKVGMLGRDYDSLLTTVLQSEVNNFNIDWTIPFDILSIDPMLPYIATLLKGVQLTPYLQDEFFYLGFSFFQDSVSEPDFDIYSETFGKALQTLLDYFFKLQEAQSLAVM